MSWRYGCIIAADLQTADLDQHSGRDDDRSHFVDLILRVRDWSWFGGWMCFFDWRSLSGLLGKFAVVYDSFAVGRRDGIIFINNKEKREKLQTSICAIHVDGLHNWVSLEKLNASLTIEAALVVPMVIFLFAMTMQAGLTLYTESKDLALAVAQEEDFDAVEMFYRLEVLGEIIGNEN